MPATAPIADPTAKTVTIVRSTSIPIRRAAGRFWAIARIARPVRECRTNRPRPPIRSAAIAMIATSR